MSESQHKPNEQRRDLMTALAITRGMKLLSSSKKTAEELSHHASTRMTYLENLFFDTHRTLFQDWKEQGLHLPGSPPDAGKRAELRNAINSLVLGEEEPYKLKLLGRIFNSIKNAFEPLIKIENFKNHDTALFDHNGFAFAKTDLVTRISRKDLATRLAKFYKKVMDIKPFEYGNKLTLDFFMTALSNIPAFKAVYGEIDFRRISQEDAKILHNPRSSVEEIRKAFKNALDVTRDKKLDNQFDGFRAFPESKTEIDGIPFLCYDLRKDGKKIRCLVTANGGLVELDKELQEKLSEGIKSNKILADFISIPKNQIIGQLPGTENLKEKKVIDGNKIGEDGAAPLVCLDTNILTGLRTPSHNQLMELIKEEKGKDAQVFDLAKIAGLKEKLLENIDKKPIEKEAKDRLSRTVEIAYEKISLVNKQMEECKENIFAKANAKSVIGKKPKLFRCMGGAGAGKSDVEKIAATQCGADGFVTTSLDDFREFSDLYHVLRAANHHRDDYTLVEPFGNTLRKWVADEAKSKNINLLYDGTSIPYIGASNSGIVKSFKESGYETSMTAVDAFLVKPEGRPELTRATAIEGVNDRFDSKNRTLPWVVTTGKHIEMPQSFLDAIQDNNLDKISLFANDGAKGESYVVAESFDVTDSELKDLQQSKNDTTLAKTLRTYMDKDESVLKSVANGENTIDSLIKKNPRFNEENVGYMVYKSAGKNRVLAIYNTQRLTDLMNKGQLNPNASGPEGLTHKKENLSFVVQSGNKDAWQVKVGDSPRESLARH